MTCTRCNFCCNYFRTNMPTEYHRMSATDIASTVTSMIVVGAHLSDIHKTIVDAVTAFAIAEHDRRCEQAPIEFENPWEMAIFKKASAR